MTTEGKTRETFGDDLWRESFICTIEKILPIYSTEDLSLLPTKELAEICYSALKISGRIY